MLSTSFTFNSKLSNNGFVSSVQLLIMVSKTLFPLAVSLADSCFVLKVNFSTFPVPLIAFSTLA